MALYTRYKRMYVPDDYHFKDQVSGIKAVQTEYDKIRQLVR